MPTPKLSIGSGLARAKRNRSPRLRAAFLSMAALRAQVQPAAKPLRLKPLASRRAKKGART